MRHSRIYGVENEALQVNGQWAFSNQLLFTAIHSHNKYFKAFNTTQMIFTDIMNIET